MYYNSQLSENVFVVSVISLYFKPPLACEFQTSSYMLTISDGNKTWTSSRDPVIIDTSQPVEVEMESEFLMDTDYLVTITVFTEYTNISSNKTFSELIMHMVLIQYQCIYFSGFETPVIEDKPSGTKVITFTNECCSTGVSPTLVGGVVGGVVFLLVLVLLCGFGFGIVVVYILRERKKRKQSMANYSSLSAWNTLSITALILRYTWK